MIVGSNLSEIKSLILVMYPLIWKKGGEKCNSFDGTRKMSIKMLNLLLYSNTDWTLQSHRVTACEDFLKLIEKIKHFPIFNHIPFSVLSHLHYLAPIQSGALNYVYSIHHLSPSAELEKEKKFVRFSGVGSMRSKEAVRLNFSSIWSRAVGSVAFSLQSDLT